MQRITWRNLFFALAAALAAYFGCMSMWGEPRRKAVFEGASARFPTKHMSPDGRVGAVYVNEYVPEPIVESKPINWILGLLGLQNKSPPRARDGVLVFDPSNGAEITFFDNATNAAFAHESGTIALINAHGTLEIWELPLASPRLTSLLAASVVAFVVMTSCYWWNRRGIAQNR